MELNFDLADEPVNKEHWSQDQKDIVQEARIIASKNDYLIYYIQTNNDSLNQWKEIASKIIKEKHGLCIVCSHSPSGFKWIFSSLSKEFSKSFSETRHFPIDIEDTGAPKTFIDFLEKIELSKDATATSIRSQVSYAFDEFSLQIHDELTVNVFEAFKILSEGVITDKNNNLELNNDVLENVRSSIFTLLYRIIFVLYAEDRSIFPVENRIYNEKFSLKWIKQNWLLHSEKISKLKEYEVQNRFKSLFHLIEVGSEVLEFPPDEFFMKSYYGRLFDRQIHAKLEKWKIPNKQLLDALCLITRTQDKKGNYFFLDYAALETRHLGSIYEHLLEFHLSVKEKKIAQLPDLERRLTASYYTPQYVVDHIIKNSIEPIISKILLETNDKDEQIEKILSLKILDPAMGSGHFLIGATEFLAKRLCEIEEGKIVEQKFIERKRDIVRHCIYGVDLNPLAVDLAKVALWLETLSSEKPLTFLSAHLKHGNSLMGQELENVFDAQQSLFENTTRRQLKKIVKDFIALEFLEDDTPSAVKAKIEKYGSMQKKGSFYYRLRGLLDHMIAESFGLKIEPWRDIRQKIGVESLDYYSTKSGLSVNELRNKYNFFHWEIEFPEVFFDQNGDRKKNAGFDVILGNPPYVGWQAVHKGTEESMKYLEDQYETATGRYDFYVLFVEQGSFLLKNDGYLGFILPHKFTNAGFGKGLRKYLSDRMMINTFLSFGHNFVFKDSTTYTCILILQKSKNTVLKFFQIGKAKTLDDELKKIKKDDYTNIPSNTLSEQSWVLANKDTLKIINKIKSSKLNLLTYFVRILQGIVTSDEKLFRLTPVKEKNNTMILFSEKIEKEIELEKKILQPLLTGSDVKRFGHTNNNNYFVIYPHIVEQGKTRPLEESELKKQFPLTFSYLTKFKNESKERKKRYGLDPKYWYTLHNSRHLDWFKQNRIVTPEISYGCNMTIDTNKFVHNTQVYSFMKKPNNTIDDRFFLGVLNSKLMWFFIKNTGDILRGGYFRFKSQYLKPFCIPKPTKKIEENLIKKVDLMLNLKQRSLDNKSDTQEIRNQILTLDKEINELVYDLYGLDEDEQKLVEKNYPSSN